MDGGDMDWQTHMDKIADRGKYILKNSLWTDCKFLVGDEQCKKEFTAHKLFLSMASPVFEKMFKSGLYLEEHNDIYIVDIQPEAFGAMLNYIYTDELEIHSFDQACELCYVANKYMIQNLLKRCTTYVLKDVNVSNACRGYEFAKLFDQRELMDKCKDVITKQTSSVISQPSFLDVQISTLKMILDEKQLNTKETDLFKAVEEWTKAEFSRNAIAEDNSEEQQKIYDQVVPKICFLNMNAKSFAEGPALSQLLRPDQSFAILLNLTTSNCSCPLPNGFSTRLREETKKTLSENVYLNWPLSNHRREIVYANSQSSMSFSCDKDIKLAGVMVMSRDPQSSFTIQDLVYEENLDIFLHDWTNNAKHITTYCATTEYSKILSIFFTEPVKIIRGRAYNIGVIMKQPGGVYIGADLKMTELIFKSHTFKFTENPLPIYMRGIIFTD